MRKTLHQHGFFGCITQIQHHTVSWREVLLLEEGQGFNFAKVDGCAVFVEHRPSRQPGVQHDAFEGHWNQFKVGASSKHFGHHGFVFDRVHAARGIDEVASGDQKGGASYGDVHLHLEHLPTFFRCPIPPNVPVFSSGGRAGARDISDDRIKARRR